MCGLFGAASTTLFNGEVQNVVELGIISQLRGKDSTGIAVGRKQKRDVDVSVLKCADHSSNFLYSDEVKRELYHGANPSFILGHCRAATHGTVNDDNAHPFTCGHIIGAHNGTVPGVRGKEAEGTDSEALFKIMEAEGLRSAINEAHKGAYALTWVDTKERTINLIRNSDRPLWLMSHNQALYWCSEFYMLRLVAYRDNINNPEIKMLPIHEHLCMEIEHPTKSLKLFKCEPDERPGFMSMFNKYGTKVEDKKEEKKEIKVTHEVLGPTKPPALPSVPQIKPPKDPELYQGIKIMVKGFNNHLMTLDVAKQRLANGCAFCGMVKDIAKGDRFHMYNKKCYVCHDCYNNPEAMTFLNINATYEGAIVTVPTERKKHGPKHVH